MSERTGYLGLGSNVGGRREHIEAGLRMLASDPKAGTGSRILVVDAVSSLYETEPVGEMTDQRDFLNAACRIRTSLEPEELLDHCKQVERARGRQEGGVRHGPRPLDVDVLLLGDLEYESERLRLPHPEVTSRRFVLEPLLELDPDLGLPDGTRLKAALEQLPTAGQGVRRLPSGGR